MNTIYKRREALLAIGSAGLTVLAGCSGGSESTPTDTSSQSTEKTSESTEQPTESTTSQEETPTVSASEWPMPNVNAARTNYHPTATGPTSSVTKQWDFQASGNDIILGFPPVISNNTIIFSGWSGIWAVDRTTGKEKWSRSASDSTIYSGPAIANETLYTSKVTSDGGQFNGELQAIDLATGQTQNNQLENKTDVGGYGQPVITDNILAVTGFSTNTVHLFVYNISTGNELWNLELDSKAGIASVSPTIGKNSVFFASRQRSTVYALSIDDGSKQWQFQTSESIAISPVFSGGVVYVQDTGDNLYALTATDGHKIWQSYGDGKRQLAVANDTLYLSLGTSSLRALDASSGEEQWEVEKPDPGVQAPPSVVSDTVYSGEYPSNVFALDAKSGDERWQFNADTDNLVWKSPVVIDNTVYMLSQGGKLYALTEDT